MLRLPIHLVMLCIGLATLATGAADETAKAQTVTARMENEKIVVMIDGKEFTSYLFGKEHKYPFFFPVIGPASGESVTTWDQEPYPHHSSLYISLDRVYGGGADNANYWQPRSDLSTGQIFSRKPQIVSQKDDKVVLSDETEWIVPSSNIHQLSDKRKVTISAPSTQIRLFDFEFELEAIQDLVIKKTGHSFFSARMRPELAVGCNKLGAKWAGLGTGTSVDSLGNRNEAGIRENAADWAATSGKNNGHAEGLAIIQHSKNPMYPAKWFIRDYGFMSPTPFAFDGNIPMPRGEKITFRYRVVVFAGDHENADIAAWHADFEGK